MSENNPLSRLKARYHSFKNTNIGQLFKLNPQRATQMSLEEEGLFFDYSKNIIDKDTLDDLFDIAVNCNLKQQISDLFWGEKINKTENRAVLHTALRDFSPTPINYAGKNIKPLIADVYRKMQRFSQAISNQQYLGSGGIPIKHIINIGIGGSDLGPRMAAVALDSFSNKNLKLDFISNVDPMQIQKVLNNSNPQEVLFIIASKTFTTEETIANAKLAKAWLIEKLGTKADISQHMVALSTNLAAVQEFGIRPENVFGFWSWVGGRFSMASAIGLSLMIYIGVENFDMLLKGMHNIDEHFFNNSFDKNIPVLLALISYWYVEFWGFESEAVLPYSADLKMFIDYLQQLQMESNGKSINRQGKKVTYKTCPIIWGSPGTDGQHSFYQLLHQGTSQIACDFIGFIDSNSQYQQNHDILMAHFFAQQQALAFGCSDMRMLGGDKLDEFVKQHKYFPGNKPCNCLLFDRLTPYNLGRLVAIYEHKTFVLGVLWDIFSFDQWGVELGKVLASQVKASFQDQNILSKLDGSTQRLIKNYLNKTHD